MVRAFGATALHIARTNPVQAFRADATSSSADESFRDNALANDAAKVAFRGLLAGARVATALVPKLPGFLLDQASRRFPDLVNMGALTIISNLYGNPAVSIPSGTVEGLPVGMPVLARHNEDRSEEHTSELQALMRIPYAVFLLK